MKGFDITIENENHTLGFLLQTYLNKLNENDNISIVLQNVLSQGQIGWTLDDGNGFKVPHQDYWPEGSYVFEDLLLSPLVSREQQPSNKVSFHQKWSTSSSKLFLLNTSSFWVEHL